MCDLQIPVRLLVTNSFGLYYIARVSSENDQQLFVWPFSGSVLRAEKHVSGIFSKFDLEVKIIDF